MKQLILGTLVFLTIIAIVVIFPWIICLIVILGIGYGIGEDILKSKRN